MCPRATRLSTAVPQWLACARSWSKSTSTWISAHAGSSSFVCAGAVARQTSCSAGAGWRPRPRGRAARCRTLMPAVAVPAGGAPPWSRRCSTRTPPGSATVLRLRKEGSRRRKAEDVASCQAAGVAGLLPVVVRLDVMLQRAMPRRQKHPAQGQGDAIWRRQEQLLQLQGAVRSNQEPLPPGPGPPQ